MTLLAFAPATSYSHERSVYMKRKLGVARALLLSLVVAIVAALASAWEPDRPVAALTARWAPPPSQFIDVNGMRVHLRDEGPRDGQPILLLHGTSASLHTWDGWVRALSGRYRVLRVDLPGFGLTGPTPDGDYSVPMYTHFITSLLDRMGIRQATLAGNSFGGYVAWKLAVDVPERVSRLILVDSSGYAYQAQSVPIGFRLAQTPALGPLVINLLPRSMIASSLANVYGDPGKITPELIDRYFELTLREGNRAAVIERFKQSKAGQFEAQIKEVRQPTLILWGDRDRLIPPENARRFQRDIAGSKLVMLEGLGHVPQEENPAATLAPVQAFLADATPTAQR